VPIYLLRRNIQLFLELRADNAAAKTFTDTESTQYARTIVHLASEDLSPLPSQMQSYSLQIIPESQQILSCRIAYLTSNAHRRKTSVITILALALVPW
jgi:beta-lactamase regulating signal transducer with metallopeptidase domain